MMFAEMDAQGNHITVYWDNRSEIDNVDTKTIKLQQIGWQDSISYLDSYLGNWDAIADICPPEFAPWGWDEVTHQFTSTPANRNVNGYVNPWTGYRLRHDFQGYSLWGRSGSGSQEAWVLKSRWDKIETDQDYVDYEVNSGTDTFLDFGGDLGIDRNLPNVHFITEDDIGYYHFDEMYNLIPYTQAESNAHQILVFGEPLYNRDMADSTAAAEAVGLSFNDQVLLYKNPKVDDKIYLKLYDDRLIPLPEHLGQISMGNENSLDVLRKDRLARRYYNETINYPPKGIEYYIAVSAWDRGIPSQKIPILESARDEDANMQVFFPGPSASSKMDNIYVVPNPYLGFSGFDGKRDTDNKGDKSRRLWFVNLPVNCQIKIWTMAGDLVDEIDHNGNDYNEEIIAVSKASLTGQAATGIHAWDLLSRYNQIIAPGVYLFTVIDDDSGDKKVGKFVVIK
jgi:hypothetical protein